MIQSQVYAEGERIFAETEGPERLTGSRWTDDETIYRIMESYGEWVVKEYDDEFVVTKFEHKHGIDQWLDDKTPVVELT